MVGVMTSGGSWLKQPFFFSSSQLSEAKLLVSRLPQPVIALPGNFCSPRHLVLSYVTLQEGLYKNY